MKKIILLLVVIIALAGCGKKEDKSAYSLTITADKLEIIADNLDKIEFTAQVKTSKEKIIDVDKAKIVYSVDNAMMLSNEFRATASGEYKIKATYNNIQSNEITVKVNRYVSEIRLGVSKTLLVSDGIDSIVLNGEILGYGKKVIDGTVDYYIGEQKLGESVFRTTIPGIYVITARAEVKISKEVLIEVVDVSQAVVGNYVLISNENIDGTTTQNTGTFMKKNTASLNKSLSQNINNDGKIYKMNPNIPFNPKGKKVFENKFEKRSTYVLGDKKMFWTFNFENNSDVQINATLQYIGTNCEIWAEDTSIITREASNKMGLEFDSKMFPLITQKFYSPSDVDGNGKVVILCSDIKDGFTGTGGYIAGYFYGGDLFEGQNSNKMEVFYIDTYPAMYKETNDVKVERNYSTLVHEF